MKTIFLRLCIKPLLALAALLYILLLSSCVNDNERHQNKIYVSTKNNTSADVSPNNSNTSDYAYSYNEDPTPQPKNCTLAQTAHVGNKRSKVANEKSKSKADKKPWFVNEQPQQVFIIDNTQSQTITGKRGVKVHFPAGCLDVDNPQQPVTIKLREYTRVVDMLLANISTTSNGELIESGGTVEVLAFDNAGNKLELKKDSEIQLSFPSAKPLPGMQTFVGEKDIDGSVNWQPVNSITPPSVSGYAGMDRIAIESRYAINIPDTLKAENFVIHQHKWQKDECNDKNIYRVFLNAFKEKLHIDDSLVSYTGSYNFDVSVRINKDVRLSDFTVKRQILIPDTFSRKEHKAINIERRKIKRQIRLIIKNSILTLSQDIANHYTDDMMYFSINIFKTDSLFGERNIINGGEKYFRNGMSVSAVEYNKPMSNSVSQLMIKDASYYLLYSGKLGMINCDRFTNESNKINYVININPDFGRKVNIIFTDIKAVMCAQPTNGDYVVNNIPKGKKVKVVVMEMRDGKQFYAIADTYTGKVIGNLIYKPYSLESIENELAEL